MVKYIPKIRWPKFVVDVISYFGSHTLMSAVDILIGILVARFLGPSNKGIMTTAMMIPVLVLNFTGLGLDSTLTYMMGKKIFSDQALISTMTLFTFISSILGIAISLLAYIFTGFHLRYGWTIIIICISIIPARMIMSLNTSILMAKNRITKLAVVNIMPNSIYLITVITILLLGFLKIESILLLQVLSVYITSVYVLSLVREYGIMVPFYDRELFWLMLKKGVIYAFASFVIGLNYSLDIVLLEHITNSREVGIYSVGVSVASLLLWLPFVINKVNFSYSASSVDGLLYAQKTATILRIVLWVAILPALMIAILAPYVIPLLYGQAFLSSAIIVRTILPGIWAMLIFNVLYSDLAGRGRPGTAFWIVALAASIDIILNIWWDPMLGSRGAAWASTVSYLFVGIFFGVVYARISKVTLKELFIIQGNDIKLLSSLFRS